MELFGIPVAFLALAGLLLLVVGLFLASVRETLSRSMYRFVIDPVAHGLLERCLHRHRRW